MKNINLMKIINFIIIMILLSSPAFANNWFIKTNVGYNHYLDKEIENKYIPSIKIKAGHNNFYIYTSYETLERHYKHVSFGSIDIISIGMGFQKKIIDNFCFYFDLGYFFPDSNLEGTYEYKSYGWERLNETQQTELAGLNLYAPDKYLRGGQWPVYSYDINGNVGGSIGIEYKQKVIDNWSLLFNIKYRFLKMEEEVMGFNRELLQKNGGYWITAHKVDMSAISFGITLKTKFNL